MIYIFLDIDGVLVKEGNISIENYAVLDPKCLTIFEMALRSFHNYYKIVISSAWKEIFDLDFIKSKFSPDIAQNIVGVTPFLEFYADVKYFRYQEILQYLEDHNLTQSQWIAIDDIKEHYPPSIAHNLIHTDCYQGFHFIDGAKLIDLLRKLNHLD